MRRRPRIVPALVLAGVVGCGGRPSADTGVASPPPIGPHGGALATLAGGRAYAEVKVEADAKAGDPGLTARVVAYFYRADLKSSLQPAPEEVRVTLRLPGNESREVPLAPSPTSEEPARFASQSGPYSVDQLMGEVSCRCDGTTCAVPFSSAR